MAKSKSKEAQLLDNSAEAELDLQNLRSEITCLVSTIGLPSSSTSPALNHFDFPKPIKPYSLSNNNIKTKTKPDRWSLKPHKPSPFSNKNRLFPSHYKEVTPTKLPLMKASSLQVWYVDAANLEAKVIGHAPVMVEKHAVEEKRKLAQRLLAQYTLDYNTSKNMKMLHAIRNSGTGADKASADSVLVGENPIANLKSLDALLARVKLKVGKRHALVGFEALKELFISSLLPDRKLKGLLQRPLNNLPGSKDGYSLLLFWYWEDCLKLRYESFVFALEEASRDVLHCLKDKALKVIYVLLRSKPELERRLLSALVNKLGDPANKTASSAIYYLSNLLADNPNMKAVVIDEVDCFLFRSHLGLLAKYNAVNFLSQILLSHEGDGQKVAKRLIDVYFALFKVLIAGVGAGQKIDNRRKTGDGKDCSSFEDSKIKSLSESHVELDSRTLSALLTGLNRAFPFVSTNEIDDVIKVQTPMLFQLVHSKNFNVGVQALLLLDKITSKNQIVSDRFYRALYSKLLLPAALNTSKAGMFIELLRRAMKSDLNLKRVSAFSKRLLQVALQQPAQYACACLFLLSEVLKARPLIWNMVHQNESVDEDLEHFEDIEEETENGPSTASKESESEDGFIPNSNIVNSVSHTEDDVLEKAEDFLVQDGSLSLHESNTGFDGHLPGVSTLKFSLPGGYNPRHREPSFCNANRVSWWELMVLASHVHPSVASMARTLLLGVNIVYNGNPLNDLSLAAFLDKFMGKKPKPSMWYGGSQIQPAKKLDMNRHLIGAEILSLAEVDVPPEDVVFHKFYMNKMSSLKKPKKKKKKKGPEENEAAEEYFQVDAGDESDNEEIENILESADPPLEREDGDYDYDNLDEVANEDEELVGDANDIEVDMQSDTDEGEELVSSDENGQDQRKRKRKSDKKAGVSPFASLEEYQHLLSEDSSERIETKNKRPQLPKKRKSSD